MLLGHPSSSVFPHCSGVLIHAGAGHTLGFLPTCCKSPSLPGHTFRTDFYLVSLKHLVTILSFLNKPSPPPTTPPPPVINKAKFSTFVDLWTSVSPIQLFVHGSQGKNLLNFVMLSNISVLFNLPPIL